MNIEEDVIETLNKTIKFYEDLDILYNSKEPCPEIRAIRWIITAYEKEKEKNKKSEEKIKKYINTIQKELDKYKIKNTNTYIQIEGTPEINGLLIQKATLEELIKEE